MRALSRAVAVGLSGGLWLAVAPGVAQADPSPLDANVVSEYGESETARSAAMGGALRALGAGFTGIYLNPAAIAETPVYHVEAATQYTPETRRWVLGAGIVDSTTSRVAGAFSIQGVPLPMDPDGIRRTSLDVRLAFALPVTERFIIGASARYFKVNQSGVAGPGFGFGTSAVSGGLVDSTSPASGTTPAGRLSLVNAFTFDVGLIVKPTDSFYIAAVGQNLTYANNGFLPLTVGGGLGYSANYFSVEVDGIADLSSWGVPGAAKPTARIMGGVEYVVAQHVPIRGGYKFDEGAKLSTVSLGSGYVGTEFAIEASVKRTASNPGATTAFLSFAYYLESTGLTKPTAPQQGNAMESTQ
jgi:hypothetical protein